MIAKDKERLRELAKRQLELANSQVMQERINAWKSMGRFQQERPMILLEMGGFEHELIPNRLMCEENEARWIETDMLRMMLPHELYDDDTIVTDFFPVHHHTYFHLFNHFTQVKYSEQDGKQTLGHEFIAIIEDLEEDYDKLEESRFGHDIESEKRRYELLMDTFGDILPLKYQMNGLYSVPTQKVVHMMGMETMLYSMMDYPELFCEMMDRIAEDTKAYFRFLEKENLLLPTADVQRLGQGTYCFTDELPSQSDVSLTSTQVWGFMDSQETVSISPKMYEEMIFPYYKRIADQYGLLSYGCCEPVHPIWENCLSTLKNLRRISISPWCDEEYMGEQLRGKNIIFHRKPSPNYLGVDPVLDEDAFYGHIKKTIQAARGCTLEITQRDVYTVHNDVSKARRYIELIRSCVEKEWSPN